MTMRIEGVPNEPENISPLDRGTQEFKTIRVPSPTLGQANYEAYIEFSKGRSLITGDLLPTWDQQSPAIREAWQMGACAVIRKFIGDNPHYFKGEDEV